MGIFYLYKPHLKKNHSRDSQHPADRAKTLFNQVGSMSAAAQRTCKARAPVGGDEMSFIRWVIFVNAIYNVILCDGCVTQQPRM